MFELIQVAPHSYYLQSPAKIGLYVPDSRRTVLIDSGNDKDAGRKVRQVLDRQGWALEAIVNTHSNADHIGGNQYLQTQTGCKIFSEGIEGCFTQFPLLEPSFLYGGYPCAELRHKFLMAQASHVLPFSDPAFPAGLEILPLPGHFFDMVGFRTPDDVVYLADCVSSETTLDKYGIPFLYDVQAYLDTLAKVSGLQARIFVPSHADATEDIAPLCNLNHEKVLAAGDCILSLCREASSFEAVLRGVFQAYHLTMTMEQYVLVGSTVRSFLSWHKDAGRLQVRFADHTMLWERT